ncbi:hypothetical protein AB0L53_56320 [Nonomuraea sp. NPDC052129]|uniref:hypothetical protein n=1 Tax=Nonomuraea sp. NPDC052129 TaxID=3154651 RepID=UPI00341D1649
MTGVIEGEPDLPDSRRVRTRQDFARELALPRERSGRTVRQVAVKIAVGGAHSTIATYVDALPNDDTAAGQKEA